MYEEINKSTKTIDVSAGARRPRWIYRSVARIQSDLWCWGCWDNRHCNGEPLGFGTATTKEAALSAASWFLHIEHSQASVFIQKPWKARWYYNEHLQQRATVRYSRCLAGTGKWFWCCWRLEEWDAENCAFATGYANTPEDADVQAIAACKRQCPTEVYVRENANSASYYRRRMNAEQKAARTSNTTNSQLREFLYTDHWDEGVSFRYRIVKRTKKRVFVDAEMWTDRKVVYGDWRDFAWSKSYSLDREKLERDGCVWCRAAGNFFYTVPWEDRHQVHPVATVEEVKRQWRKRLFDAHPDQGGDVEEFKRVFAEYERAISMAT